MKFGSEVYSQEELVAEMGAAILSNYVGITTDDGNTIAYCRSWLSKLKDNVQMLVKASSEAENAVKYMCPDIEKDKDVVTGNS